jgi:hypothetical protein
LIILISVFLYTNASRAQRLDPSIGFKEIVVGINQLYIYPERVLYFFPSAEGLDITLSDGQLYVRNPRGLRYVNIQVIKEDGSADYIKVLAQTRLKDKQTKERRVDSARLSNSNINISYSHGYNSSEANRNGDYLGRFLMQNNSLFLKNKINKDNTFSLNWWDSKSEFFNGEQQYQSFYNLIYEHKNLFYEHGFLPSNPKATIFNNSSVIWLNRVGFKTNKWYIAVTEGSNREQNRIDPSTVYGFNLFYDNFNDFLFNSYVFHNPTYRITTPTFATQFKVNKNLTIKGEVTKNIDALNDQESINYQYSFFYNRRDVPFFRNFSFTNRVIQNGVFDPVFGGVSTSYINTKNMNSLFDLYSDKESKQKVNFNLNYNNVTTDNTYNQGGGASINWAIAALKFGLRYQYGETSSLINEDTSNYMGISPSISFAIMPEQSNRARNITVTDYIMKNSRGIEANVLRLSYNDNGATDRYNLSFMKRAQSDDQTNNKLDVFFVGARANYLLSSKFNWSFQGQTILNRNQTQKVDDQGTLFENDTGYFLSNYGFGTNLTYKLNRQHSFKLGVAQNTVQNDDFHSRITSMSLFYNFNFNGNWKSPINYIVNNKSIKLHYYKDLNYNEKMDKGEPLIKDLSININGDDKYSERKTTDSDGYVRFSGLAAQNYQIIVEDPNYQSINPANNFFNLTDGSVTKESPLGKMRSIILKTLDIGKNEFFTGNFYYNVFCPSVGYTKRFSSVGSASIKVNIPDTTGCTASLDPTLSNQYFEFAELDEKAIDNTNDVIFKIEHINKIEVSLFVDLDKDGKVSVDEYYFGKEIYIEFNGVKNYPNEEGVISIILDEKAEKKSYWLNKILKISPKFNCIIPQESYTFKESFYQRFTSDLKCTKK